MSEVVKYNTKWWVPLELGTNSKIETNDHYITVAEANLMQK
jgi:hypothetical protein